MSDNRLKDSHEIIRDTAVNQRVQLEKVKGDDKKFKKLKNDIQENFKNAINTLKKNVDILNNYDNNKDGKLTEEDIRKTIEELPNARKEAKELFARMEKERPDNTPNDGSIDIYQIAKKEIDFLDKTFPDIMKVIKKSISEENIGKKLTPLQTFNIIQTKAEKLGH